MKFKDMPYERVNVEEAEKEFKQLMEEFRAAKSGEEQFAVHQKFYTLQSRIYTNVTIAHIRHDIDTVDEFYSKEQDYNDQIVPTLDNLEVAYMREVYESPYRAYLEEKIGPVAFKNIELSLKATDEKLIPLRQEENALCTEYNKLIATIEIDWEGETLNLSLLAPYMHNKDRNIRQKAWNKLSEVLSKQADKLDEIYDKLVKNRTAQAKEMGYENYIELGYYRMNRNCYDKEAVENFRNQVKTYFVPFAEKLHERRRQRLGLDKLSFIDEGVYFKNGNPVPVGTPDEIMASGQKMYEELSPETKEFFDLMMENELFDVLGRRTKKAGGYMTQLPDYKVPFIFANFNKTDHDVNVITHECGHAFQGYLAMMDPILEHQYITMETAEVHSMSMEFFTEPWMELFFGDRAEDYRAMHLEDSAAFIPYGCMVDEFQHIVYENPDMTPAERNAVWTKLEKEYKPHLDYNGDAFFSAGRFWQRQQHIYNSPFYYIDYCIAQTCAFQYKVKIDEDFKAAWESYLKLCKLSASDFFTGLVKQVGLDNPFEDGCLKAMVGKLEKKIQ